MLVVMSGSAIAQSIAASGRFIASQSELMPGESLAASKAAMVISLVAQVNSLRVLSPEEAGIVNAAISGTPFDAVQKTQLATAVGVKVSQSASAGVPGRGSGSTVTQTLLHPNNYLTEGDWAYIHECASGAHACQRVTDRLARCGLISPSEDTLAQMTGMIASAIGEVSASAPRLYGLYTEFKSQRGSARTRQAALYGGSSILVSLYTINPTDLPERVFSAAYSEGLPVAKDFPMMRTLADRTPRRRTHRDLRNDLSIVPSGSRASGSAQNPMNDFAVQMMQFMSNMQRHLGGPGSEPRITITGQADRGSAPRLNPDRSPESVRSQNSAEPASLESLLTLPQAANARAAQFADDIQYGLQTDRSASSGPVSDVSRAAPVNDGLHHMFGPRSFEAPLLDRSDTAARSTACIDDVQQLERLAMGAKQSDGDGAAPCARKRPAAADDDAPAAGVPIKKRPAAAHASARGKPLLLGCGRCRVPSPAV